MTDAAEFDLPSMPKKSGAGWGVAQKHSCIMFGAVAHCFLDMSWHLPCVPKSGMFGAVLLALQLHC